MKKIQTIPAGVDFIAVLVDGILEMTGGEAAALPDMRLLLPTRRSCLHLREAFLARMKGNAALLPRMQALGDIDDDELYFIGGEVALDIPPAITPLRRKMLLTRLIAQRDKTIAFEQAAQLAEALARFLDETQIMGGDFTKLEQLVETRDLAEHWQETVAFLKIVTDLWPAVLAEEGIIDPADRRNRLLYAQAGAWLRKPPSFPIIAAGSTGSLPSTAALLDAIASLPKGVVVLQGLDLTLDENAWQAIKETHPQWGMKQLLEKFGVTRKDVPVWRSVEAPRPLRIKLIQESMRPADVTEEWRHLNAATLPVECLEGLQRIELDHPQEEAQAIALVMRRSIEIPFQTAALVTPDRGLAERVVDLLRRWGIEANDSAGLPLTDTPVGAFLSDLLDAAEPQAGAVPMLALLKHPLSAFGLSPAACHSHSREAELAVWRQEKPEKSIWLETVRETFRPLSDTWKKPLPLAERVALHRQIAEAVATSDTDDGSGRLWQGDDGEAAAMWFDDWRDAGHDFPPLTGTEYSGLFDELTRAVTVRPNFGQHPRLDILGPLEARLIQADTIILGGLNEGIWPAELPVDPWMSRPMKHDFGLPAPEHRIGLSAHDFEQLANAPNVFLTRARRAGNAPTLPTRFLLQIDTVLRVAGHIKGDIDLLKAAEPWKEWVRQLDAPEVVKPCAAPSPRPPADARPDSLSVTEIGLWQRNPYAIYAKHVLKLPKLGELDAGVDSADRGTLIHGILYQFLRQFPVHIPADGLDKLFQIGRRAFEIYREHPQVHAFWWPRFERIATWFVDHEVERRARGIMPLKPEASGSITLDTFRLRGRADRIDKMPDGKLAIVDYKTGTAPTDKDVESGIEPQLALLSFIASKGGFTDIPATQTAEIGYWKLGGGRETAKPKVFDENIGQLVSEAEAGLKALIASFADENTPYEAVPKPERAAKYDDYSHLARLAEWGRSAAEE